MVQVKNVLVSVDPSALAAVTLRYAVLVARTFRARLTVVHAMQLAGEEPRGTAPEQVARRAALCRAVERELTRLVEQVPYRNPSRITIAVEEGELEQVIRRLAGQQQFDLIVVGQRQLAGSGTRRHLVQRVRDVVGDRLVVVTEDTCLPAGLALESPLAAAAALWSAALRGATPAGPRSREPAVERQRGRIRRWESPSAVSRGSGSAGRDASPGDAAIS